MYCAVPRPSLATACCSYIVITTISPSQLNHREVTHVECDKVECKRATTADTHSALHLYAHCDLLSAAYLRSFTQATLLSCVSTSFTLVSSVVMPSLNASTAIIYFIQRYNINIV